MGRLFAWLLRSIGRKSLAFVAVLAILMAGAWLSKGLSDLQREESALAKLKDAVASKESAMRSEAQVLESLGKIRQQHAQALLRGYHAEHARVVRLGEDYRALWEASPIQRRIPFTEVYEELMRRLAVRELATASLKAHLAAWQWASGQKPAQWAPGPAEMAAIARSAPEVGSALKDIAERSRRLQQLGVELQQAQEQASAKEAGIANNFIRWLRDEFFDSASRQLGTALAIIVAATLAPWLIRGVFYFVLAPLASRCPPFRVGDDESVESMGAGEAGPGAESAMSLSILLESGECLAALSEFIHGAPQDASRRTRWLLDWRHPFTSLAAGLFPLEEIRGDGRPVVMTSTQDPLQELARIRVPEGAAMVFKPRGLVGVVHPAGRPPRITSQWRLGSLHAWLTLQLRYLVFHGPVDLVARGCRGVRVEVADGERAVRQDATLGFSTSLRYSTARSNPAMPYLRGQADLFIDRISGAGGWIAYEVVPRKGRQPGKITSGLEGGIDAVMNAFGI